MAHAHPNGFRRGTDGSGTGRTLVIILHGWNAKANSMHDVEQAVRQSHAGLDGLDIYLPLLPHANLFSFASAARTVAGLTDAIDILCANPDRYARLVLVGHSMGAVLARRLFLVAAGADSLVPSEPELHGRQKRHWAARIERIVTLGGLNRGWTNSGRLSWVETIVANLIAVLGHGSPASKKPIAFQIRRGAPFIVQTRLQWLAMTRLATPLPLVIQLLGTRDSLVGPDDAVDFATDNDSYYFLELPNTEHTDAIHFSGAAGAAREALFRTALTADRDELAPLKIPFAHLTDSLPPRSDPSITHVVFVIHGIRDEGYWTRKIAQRIHERAERDGRDGAGIRCITSSYGYFTILPFIFPWIRMGKVEWLMDLYVGARAQFPEARFSYVGHSNGTYLAARALLDYPAISFHNVLFAGSVVRRDYDWRVLCEQGRVRSVVNMIATADWVVGFFSTALEPGRGFFDVGGAGFGGFTRPYANGPVHELRFVTGGHGAGVTEEHWPEIAAFIVDDVTPVPPVPANKQSTVWRMASRVSTLLVLTALVLLAGWIVHILWPIVSDPHTTALAAAGRVGAVLAIFGLVRFIVTRV